MQGAAFGASSEPEQKLQCPRCESTNTKFCYYNNYNLSQPRHFCKDCRRYWTKGGALRNVPVGGGTRKSSKRSSAAAVAGGSDSKRPSSDSSTANEVLKPEPLSVSFPPPDDDHRMLDISGSFSSLLCSTAHFGNFLECYPSPDSVPIFKGLARQMQEPELQSSAESSVVPTAPAVVPENFLGLPGDSSSWLAGGRICPSTLQLWRAIPYLCPKRKSRVMMVDAKKSSNESLGIDLKRTMTSTRDAGVSVGEDEVFATRIACRSRKA